MRARNKADYFEKLKDPRWQKKRLEVFEYYDFKCSNCGEKTKQLHAHHKIYLKNLDPWEYGIEFLTCLCDDCHKGAHNCLEKVKNVLGVLNVAELPRVFGYIQALVMEDDEDFIPQIIDYETAMGMDDVFRIPCPGMEGVDAILKKSDNGRLEIKLLDINEIRKSNALPSH